MGDLTSCSYCTLQRMKASAKARGNRIKVRRPSDTDKLAALYPGAQEVMEINPRTGEERRLAWMAEIPKHCCC